MTRNSSKKSFGHKLLPLVLAFAVPAGMAVQLTVPATVLAADTDPVFQTQVGGVFNGMPLFDGEPAHLDAFVDAYFAYTGLEGPAVYATGSRNHYTLQRGTNAGKTIPGALSAADNVQGVSTDFPALVGMGQTWNKQLLNEIGQVMGAEKISQLKVKQGESNIHGGADASLSVAFTVVSDLRINPLSGRFDEGYAEDAYLAGTMVDEMASGLSGTDQPESDDGFWMRAAVGTKHFSVYNAQWFRQSASNSAAARSIYEYHTRSVLPALSSGSVAGVMTSFGRTNGIPNIFSPYQIHANNYAKYGVYSSPDFNGDQLTFGANTMGNGYDDKYAQDRTLANVLMVLAEANAGRPSPSAPNAIADVTALVDAVEQGKYGITEEDLIEVARSHVNQLVRIGIFNETDSSGFPMDYPFAQDAKDVRTEPAATFALAGHQDVALRAAQESIVLLKNDGTLPLSKTQQAAVSGVYADSRFKTTYSVGTTPALPESGDSPLLSIIKQIGGSNVSFDTGAKVVALTSKLNGEVVTAASGATGAQLDTAAGPVDENNNAQLFEQFDWGQEGYSLRSKENDKWVTSPSTASAAVGNTDATSLNLTNNDWDLAQMLGNTSTIPPRLRIETNADDSVSIVSNGYRTGFSGDFTNFYYASGRFVAVGSDGLLSTNATVLTNAQTAETRADSVKFDPTVVQEVGETAAARATQDDYAIVFVGAIPRHSAGEGNDRSSLAMGDADYELVNKVSAAFAAEGKKTIVVVKTSFPVEMEQIQNNPNVAAIVYQPYGGQYDSKALAQVLYGDYAPTGRLTSTWYADESALPAIDKYAIPEGNTTISLGTNLDPRFTVDMSNSDPVEAELTYMYTKAPTTYEFGYGMSYSSFAYSGLQVPASATGTEPFTVSVNVKNEGTVNTSEVVQLYVHNNQSAYGAYAPSKQLASYEKVALQAGETKTVTLTVNPQDFAVWDVNKGELVVEKGTYAVSVGSSSKNIHATGSIAIAGNELQTLNVYKSFNVFDHAFASDDVVYNEVSKERTAVNLKAKQVAGQYYAVHAKNNGSWVAIPKVDLTNTRKVTATVAAAAAGGFITLHADSPTSAPIAMLEVPVTAPKSYTIANAGVPVTELGYADVTVDLSNTTLSGLHDLYVVFKAPDLRIDSLSFQSVPTISAAGQIAASSSNPSLTITAGRAPFAAAASDPANWTFNGQSSGLTLSSVTVNANSTSATLHMSGNSAAGAAYSVTAKAAAFDGNVTDSAALNLSVASSSGSSGSGGGGTTEPTTTPPTTTPPVTEPGTPNADLPTATVDNATEADLAKTANIRANGVTTVGAPVHITADQAAGAYALATIKVSPAAGQTVTALALVQADGTLTPVPSRVTRDNNGDLVMVSLVHTTGTYVAISAQRSFRDVPAQAWYANEIAQASGLLLLNGVSATTMKPQAETTTAQTLMVALNVLGLTPEKAADDAKWYDAVARTAQQIGLIDAFATDEPITREDMAVILVHALEYAGIDTALTTTEVNALLADFGDNANISASNRAAFAAAVKFGIFKGNAAGQLSPSDILTRAQLAAVALRTHNAVIGTIPD